MHKNNLITLYFIFTIILTFNIIASNHGEIAPIDLTEGTLSSTVTDEQITSSSWDWNTAQIWEMNSDQILKFFDRIPANRFDELDDDELEEALEQKYAIDNVQIDLGSNTNDVEFTIDSFYFDSAQYLGIGTVVLIY